MKVFVAGHRGLVGSSLIRNVSEEFEIVTASHSELDLRDRTAVRNFLMAHKPSAVILAAARVGGIQANSRLQSDFLVENLDIQNSVISECANLNIQNLVFLGSSCIYPKFAPQPIRENSLLSGYLESTNEGYALAKIAGVKLMRAFYEEKGLNYISLMPTNLYGQNDNFDYFSSHVPASLMRRFHEAKISKESRALVWGSGTPVREFMHVDDLARACWMFLKKGVGGQLINIGTGKGISIRDFAELMANVIGYTGEIGYESTKPDGTPQKILDVQKAHSFGWSARIPLEEGLKMTYEWFKVSWEKGEIRGY